MSGKITRIDTGETETGGQNEPLPPVVHQEETPAEESVGPAVDWDKPQE